MDSFLNERVHDLIARYEADGLLVAGTGIGAAVVEGRKVFTGTYGWRERDRRLPVTSQTLFEIGSLTKAFTSAALLMTGDKGQIDLKRPINASTQLLTLSDADVSRQISIADILAHRTGLPANDLLWYFHGSRLEELPAALAHLELIPGAFRHSFIYSNLMYGVLGQLFDALVGESWETCVTRRILQPLDMSSTVFHIAEEAEDVALPYVGSQRVERLDTAPVAAAGGIKSTLDDMTRWMQFHLDGARTLRGEQLLSDAAATAMHRGLVTVESPDPIIFQGLEWLRDSMEYGFGWFLGSTRKLKVIFHPGFSEGFSTALVMIPEKQLGLFVIMNNNLSPVPGLIVEDLLAALLDPGHRRIEPATSNPHSGRDRSVIGEYEDPAFGAISVDVIRNRLVLNYKGHQWPLTWTGERSAAVEIPFFGVRIPLSVEFTTAGGSARQLLIALSLDPRVKPRTFVRASN